MNTDSKDKDDSKTRLKFRNKRVSAPKRMANPYRFAISMKLQFT